MSRIDYVALEKIHKNQGDEKLLDECIRLAGVYPDWDWSRTPGARNEIVTAHQKIFKFLKEQARFAQYLHDARAEVAPAAAAPPVMQFIERWHQRGARVPVTSDHAMVTNTFNLQGAAPLSLRVSTWNLMNKAHSKDNCHIKDPITGKGLYANTPEEDLDENDDSYRARKKVQISQIIGHIKSGQAPDSMFLQEIDFLTTPKFSGLAQDFKAELKKLGFEVLITPVTPLCKPQAIIYNANVLTLDPTNPSKTLMPGTEVEGKDKRNTLFEANFTHKKTGKKVCLASAHLDFDGNYSHALREYSARKAAAGAMVIWGGDTNHAPGHNIQGLTGDFNHATNYDVAQAGGHTVHHAGSTKAKAYDGFGFCPPPGCKIQSTEEPGLRFKFDSRAQSLSIESFQPKHPHHISLSGYPWMRRQEIVLDILGYRNKMLDALVAGGLDHAEAKQITSEDEVAKIDARVEQVGPPLRDLSQVQQLISESSELVKPGNDIALQSAMDNPARRLVVAPAVVVTDHDIVARFLKEHGDSSYWKGKTADNVTIQNIVDYANKSNENVGFPRSLLKPTGTATRDALSKLGVKNIVVGEITVESVRNDIGAIRAPQQPPAKVTADQRIAVLKDTLSRLETPAMRAQCHEHARQNLQRAAPPRLGDNPPAVRVIEGDWGDVTQAASKANGKVYAVLNMANAYVKGGGYVDGMIAQEENMFRRTDCHFSDTDDATLYVQRYRPEMTALINGENRRVELDMHPRVCIKGKEDGSAQDGVGYPLLREDQYFEFYELRSAADDLRRGQKFSEENTRKKIAAQLDTLIEKGIRHVVLSAFGCGAFKNPPGEVARIYKEEIERRPGQFDDIVFAIYYAGYGPKENFEAFRSKLDGLTLGAPAGAAAPLRQRGPAPAALFHHRSPQLARITPENLYFNGKVESTGGESVVVLFDTEIEAKNYSHALFTQKEIKEKNGGIKSVDEYPRSEKKYGVTLTRDDLLKLEKFEPPHRVSP